MTDVNESLLALAQRLDGAASPLEQFIAAQLSARHRDLEHRAVADQRDSPELRHALQEERKCCWVWSWE